MQKDLAATVPSDRTCDTERGKEERDRSPKTFCWNTSHEQRLDSDHNMGPRDGETMILIEEKRMRGTEVGNQRPRPFTIVQDKGKGLAAAMTEIPRGVALGSLKKEKSPRLYAGVQDMQEELAAMMAGGWETLMLIEEKRRRVMHVRNESRRPYAGVLDMLKDLAAVKKVTARGVAIGSL